MKIRYILCIGLSLIIIGYILGNCIPIEILRPNITTKEITLNDLYTRIISIIGTIVTVFAVIVALAKEDIRKWWDFASFEIRFRDENKMIEILTNELSSATSGNSYKAKKYESILIIKNKGSIAAKNCEIYLERLQFKSNDFPSHQEIQSSSKPLSWNNNSNNSILIPATGKAYISAFEIILPSIQSVPSEQSTSTDVKPKIIIGGAESPNNFINGTWEAKFIIYSENTKPCDFSIIIKWNNKWENRLVDLSKHLTVDLKLERK